MAGFTMFEFLVVISVIAILAVAIITVINPVEQRRKLHDDTAVNLSKELNNALDRYYLSYSCYPWEGSALGLCDQDVDAAGLLAIDPSVNLKYLLVMEEVKSNFIERLTDLDYPTVQSIVVNETPGNNHSVCFDPESKSMNAKAAGEFTAGMQSCPASSDDCYLCIPESRNALTR